MKYSKQSIFHDYSVFIAWRTIFKFDQESIRKNRIIVNIKELNKITQVDNYFMSLQVDITSAVAKCKYINVFDTVAFFYQWKICVENKSKLTMILHREQKQSNVAVMKFKKSSTYVQR